jgi:hypothetical protein
MKKCDHFIVDLHQLLLQYGELFAIREISVKVFLQVAHDEGQSVCEEGRNTLAAIDTIANVLLNGGGKLHRRESSRTYISAVVTNKISIRVLRNTAEKST